MTESTTANPLDRLKSEATGLLGAVGDRAFSSLRDRVEGATEHLTDITNGDAQPGLKAALGGAKSLAEGKSPAKSMLGAGMTAMKEKVGNMIGKGGGGGGKKKITNIIESIDVGVPISLAYNQWTQFTDFPNFMKKVENVDQQEDEKITFKAQVLWSHREWESTILEQQPDDKIVWRSKGAKGYVDGAVTFHELAPNLTRILVVLEYHPQGFFEHTGNLWRAQGRRVRLELKHFRRHIMTEALLHPDEIEGWRGEISDGEVQKSGDSSGNGRGGRSASKNGDSGSSRQRSSSGNGAKASSGGGGSSSASGSRRSTARSSASRPATKRSSSSGSSGGSRSSGSSSGRSARSQSGSGSSGTKSRSRQTAGRGSRSGGNS